MPPPMYLDKVEASGYQGIEWNMPPDKEDPPKYQRAIEKKRLLSIIQQSKIQADTPKDYKERLKKIS